jgi:hypothetical protein
MSEIKENFITNNTTSRVFCPEINLNSSKDYSLKELKTSHNGLVCINYNSEYLRERLCKLKEESNYLIKKINIIENTNLKEKNNLEKIIISLREDRLVFFLTYGAAISNNLFSLINNKSNYSSD